MAQADAKEDASNMEDYNPVSESVEYGLYSVSSQNHLSGRGGQKNPKLKSREPKGDKYLTWKFELVEDGKYALTPLSAAGYYLDGRDGKKDPLMKKGNPKTDKSLQWQVIKVKENKVGLQGVASGNYLSGRGGQEDPTMQKRDVADDDEYLQWILVPLNYKLHAKVSEYDFGSAEKIDEILSNNKTISAHNTQKVTCKHLGMKVKFYFSEKMKNTFTISTTQSWGVSVSIETDAKLPMIGGSSITVTGSYNGTKSNETSKSQSEEYTVGYTFEPQSVGRYQVGMIVYCCKNIKLDYVAKVVFTGKEDGSDNVLDGSDIPALLFYNQCDANIKEVKETTCVGTVTGSVVATYGIETQTYSKKVEE